MASTIVSARLLKLRAAYIHSPSSGRYADFRGKPAFLLNGSGA
jgi:hypothetical protein